MMQRIWILAAPLLLVTGCSAERAEPVDKDAIAQAVKTDVQSIVDAFNARDADAALELCAEFAGGEPAVVIVKHANPCGVAQASSLLEAWNEALACDSVSRPYRNAHGLLPAIRRAAAWTCS